MKTSNTCPKCASKDIIRNARAVDKADNLADLDMEVVAYTKPEALLFKGEKRCKLTAFICSSCGFVEYYAENPTILLG